MATNRLYVRHLPTDDTFVLAKFYYGTGWFTRPDSNEEKIMFVDSLDQWFKDHIETTDDYFNGGANYVLEYEVGGSISPAILQKKWG